MLSRVKADEEAAYGGLPENLRTGEISPEMQKGLRKGIIRALIAILGVAAFTILSLIGAPFILGVFITAWFAGSIIYLLGLGYSILNDIIGCHHNLPYFMLGHQPGQRGLIKSNDKTAVAIAWGIFAGSGLSLVAGVLFATTTLIMGFVGLPFAAFALPLIAVILPVVLLGAHLRARKKERTRNEMKKDRTFFNASGDILENPYKTSIINPREINPEFKEEKELDPYQTNRLKHWLKDDNDANAWMGNSDMNTVGFAVMPLVGVAGLVSIITFSAAHTLLPAVLFSSAAFAVFPPLGLGLLLVVGIVAACAYLYINRNKQVNNGFKLDYPPDHKAQEQQAEASDKKPGHELDERSERSLSRRSSTHQVASVIDKDSSEQKKPEPEAKTPATDSAGKQFASSLANHSLLSPRRREEKTAEDAGSQVNTPRSRASSNSSGGVK